MMGLVNVEPRSGATRTLPHKRETRVTGDLIPFFAG